jgi:transposase-like protein
MSQKVKVGSDEKIIAVRDILSGRKSLSQTAEEMNVNLASVQSWVSRYQAEGALAFLPSERNRAYPPELKQHAVEDYLAGKGSQQNIAEKYKLRSKTQLQRWIKVYNSGKDFKHKMSGGSRMKARKTTQKERIEIARACIESGENYGEIAIRYQVSYQQVYTWTKKYKELGEAGLEDRRGKRVINQEPRTEEEELRRRIAELEHEKYLLEVENTLLKKLDELERRDAYRK